jgi:hypothetical protein
MGADKNASRRRLKLQQDELARSDPQNHTLLTSTFRLPKPRSHWSATSPMNKHYQQTQLLRTHDSGNNSGAGCPEGAARPGMGAVRPPPPSNQEILQNTSSEHQNAPRFHQHRSLVKTVLATRKFWRKPKLNPGPRGGLTSCTHHRTPSKNSYQTARERPEISPERSFDQGEQTHRGHRGKSGEIKTSTWKAQGG